MRRLHVHFTAVNGIVALVVLAVLGATEPVFARNNGHAVHEIRMDMSVFKVRFTRRAVEEARDITGVFPLNPLMFSSHLTKDAVSGAAVPGAVRGHGFPFLPERTTPPRSSIVTGAWSMK